MTANPYTIAKQYQTQMHKLIAGCIYKEHHNNSVYPPQQTTDGNMTIEYTSGCVGSIPTFESLTVTLLDREKRAPTTTVFHTRNIAQ